MDRAEFAIVLEDLFSPGATKAKRSVDALSETLSTAKSELSGYQSQLSLAKGLGDIEGYRKYSALVDKGKRSVFDLTQQLETAQSSLTKSAVSAETFAGALGPIGIAAGVAAAGVAGLVAILAKFTHMALEESNEKQGLIASFEALGKKGSGEKVFEMVGDLAAKLPQSDKLLFEWTKHLQAMGVTDLSKIRSELVATASAQAIMGDKGAAAYTKLQDKVNMAIEAHKGLKIGEKALKALYSAGVNQEDMARRMGMSVKDMGTKLKAGTMDAAKFGEALRASVTEKGKGPLDVMMNSLDALGKKAGEALGNLFEDIDTKPLTDALRNLIALGEGGAPSGEALKAGFVPAMNAVIKMIGNAIVEGEVLFLRLEVGALRTYIAFKPLISALEKVMYVVDIISNAKERTMVNMGLSKEQMQLADMASPSILSGLTGGLSDIPTFVGDLIASIGDAKAQEIAKQQGVNIGKATIEGIREGAGTHSPSIPAMQIGGFISEGLGIGMVNSGVPDRAAKTVSSNALAGLSRGGGGPGSSGGDVASSNTTIGPITITIVAPDGVTDAEQLSVTGLSTALERFQIGSGR